MAKSRTDVKLVDLDNTVGYASTLLQTYFFIVFIFYMV